MGMNRGGGHHRHRIRRSSLDRHAVVVVRGEPEEQAGLHPGDGGAGQSGPSGGFSVRTTECQDRQDGAQAAYRRGRGTLQRWCWGVCKFRSTARNNASGGAQPTRGASRGCVSHPACKRVPQAAERVDGAVPRGSNALFEELSRLAQDVGALWERSRYQALFA